MTQGQFIRAEIIEGGAKSCTDSQMEPELALFNEAGEELVTDTFGGRGSCSMIDGRETWYSDAGNLPAGNYYLRVRSNPGAAAGKETFDYRLSVTVRESEPRVARERAFIWEARSARSGLRARAWPR